MRILDILRLRMRSLFRRAAVEAELQDEFQDYLEREIEAGIARGISPSEVRVSACFLFRVTPHDPFAFALTPAVLAVVAFVAVWVPARRASRLDPVEALRHE
jgi:hypothetical protein